MVWTDERKELPIIPAYWRTCLPSRYDMVLRRYLLRWHAITVF